MSDGNNNELKKPLPGEVDKMDGGPVESNLNSDNSFSDNGLENARLTREALNKANSK